MADAIRTRLPKKNKWKGTTRILAITAEAVKMFGEPQPGDSIILISDGGDNRTWNIDDISRVIQQSGVRLSFWRDPTRIRIAMTT
jgi:hypothetical protein